MPRKLGNTSTLQLTCGAADLAPENGKKGRGAPSLTTLTGQLIFLTAFETRNLCRMKVHRRSLKRSICLSLIKFINENLQPLAAHFELLDSSLQACYRIIDRIYTPLTVYPSGLVRLVHALIT